MSILYGLIHGRRCASCLRLPAAAAEAAGVDERTTANYLSLAMIALGIGTLLQCWGRWGIGSGFLLPSVYTAIFLPPAIAAAHAGGLGAVAGLTMVAGITSIVLSRVIQRIRVFLPAEVVGLVVTVGDHSGPAVAAPAARRR